VSCLKVVYLVRCLETVYAAQCMVSLHSGFVIAWLHIVQVVEQQHCACVLLETDIFCVGKEEEKERFEAEAHIIPVWSYYISNPCWQGPTKTERDIAADSVGIVPVR